MHEFVETAEAGFCASGAYALLIELEEPLRVNAGARSAPLAPGLYVYCGSARGPGGVAARLARHMRSDRRPHWHVDQLTDVGKILGAWVFPGRGECEVNEDLAAWPTPLDRFGSSDCRRCRAHLRFWPPGAPLPGQWESPPLRQGAFPIRASISWGHALAGKGPSRESRIFCQAGKSGIVSWRAGRDIRKAGTLGSA